MDKPTCRVTKDAKGIFMKTEICLLDFNFFGEINYERG